MLGKRLAIVLLIASLLAYAGGLAQAVHECLDHPAAAEAATRGPASGSPARKPDNSPSHDDCPVCQLLAGIGATIEAPTPCPAPTLGWPDRPAAAAANPAAPADSFPIAARAPPTASA